MLDILGLLDDADSGLILGLLDDPDSGLERKWNRNMLKTNQGMFSIVCLKVHARTGWNLPVVNPTNWLGGATFIDCSRSSGVRI